MKLISIILSLILAQNVFALELSDLRKQALEGKKDCNGSVFANDSYGYYANSSTLNVIELSTGKLISQVNMISPITSIKSDAHQLFILTESNLEIYDLAGQKKISTLATYPNVSAPFSFYQQPRGFEISEDKIYIAHGLYGVVVYNRKTEAVEAIIPVQSTVRDITLYNNKAVMVIDNNTEGGFHGFGFINLKTNQVEKYVGFENVFPESVTISGDTLLVGFYSVIWKYNTQDVFTSSQPKVLGRVYNFPSGLGAIVGKAHYDNKHMYACYDSMDENGQNHKQIVVFDRKSLNL